MGSVDQSLIFEHLVDVSHHFVGTFGRNFLVVVTGEEGASVDGVVLVEDVVDSENFVRVGISSGNDVQPCWKET